MCCRICLALFVILQLIAVAAVTIGTPFDMYRPKSSTSITDNSGCLTLWGSKKKCYSSEYDVKTNDYWKGCPARRDRFRTAEVCAIITIAAFFVSLILGLIQCCCCLCCKFVCFVFNLVGVITGIITFALVLDSWFNRRGPTLNPICAPIKDYDFYNLGAGFGLLVGGVALGFINLFVVLLPC